MKKSNIIKIIFVISLVLCLSLPTLSISAENGDSTIVNVTVPMNLDFTLDPGGIAGLGQIYSEEYEFRNYGDTDAILTIADYEVIFANYSDFLAVPYEIAVSFDDAPPQKVIQIFFDIGGEQLILTDDHAGTLEVYLPAGETVLARIGGSMNPYPAKTWQPGDVKISVNYQIKTVEQLEPDVEPEVINGESEPDTVTDESSEMEGESSDEIEESSETSDEPAITEQPDTSEPPEPPENGKTEENSQTEGEIETNEQERESGFIKDSE